MPQFVRFSELPTDIAILVFTHAAQPTFAQPATFATNNPYSLALSLSCVCKIARRCVLPEILHTVLLAESRHVTAFVQALRMQKTYAEQQQHDLSLDYASRVHRMWIGEFGGLLRIPNAPSIRSEPGSELDVSLLAPVLLATPSLSLDFASLDVLLGCLEHAWNSDIDLNVNVDRRSSLLPWSTKKLTLSGCPSRQWWPFIGTVHGYTFLASIQHLTLLSCTPSEKSMHFQGRCISVIKSRDSEPYMMPFWMARAPFKKLKTFSLAMPHIESPVAESASSAKETWVKLVTLPASLLPEPWTHQEIKTFVETGVGFIPYIFLPVSCSQQLCTLCLDCEKLWACGCEGPLARVSD